LYAKNGRSRSTKTAAKVVGAGGKNYRWAQREA